MGYDMVWLLKVTDPDSPCLYKAGRLFLAHIKIQEGTPGLEWRLHNHQESRFFFLVFCQPQHTASVPWFRLATPSCLHSSLQERQ